jgi:SAM-dependent methyltransferase
MGAIALHPTSCPVCNRPGNARQLYAARLSPHAFEPSTFSARRVPDRLHYRVVRCNACGLVRADPVADRAVQADLYQRSAFDYSQETDNLKMTYGRYLRRLERLQVRKGALLEIGCGNGFFLEEALLQGYARVCGVEPSLDAVAKASPMIRPLLICGLMSPGLFDPEQFDVVCMFQTFDHIPDPGALLDECFQVLRPGGLLLCLNHDVQAPSARLLGERSPIIDVEHPFLYSSETLSRLLTARGFRVRSAGPVLNRISLRYLVHLLPLPRTVKSAALHRLQSSRIGSFGVRLPLGNLFVVAQRPEAT